MNSVTLIGRLTRDPELTELKTGNKVCRMGFAVDNPRENGETCFIDLVAFGRQAEVCRQYLLKGHLAAVEGRLDFHRWNGKDGKQRSAHSVIANRVQFLEPRRGTDSPSPQPQAPAPQPESAAMPEPQQVPVGQPHVAAAA